MGSNGYNFSSQEVFLSESNPSVISVINENKLVIVYESIASIKIYDLTVISEQNKPIITIPLIETNVKQLIHSHFGNYLAIFADNDNTKTVRVYTNYWIEGQPIRVRPNGSLPLKNGKQQTDHHLRESLAVEVIQLNDISIRNDCQHITCCESNADIFVCCGYRVLSFSYQTFKLSNNMNKTDFIFLLDIRLQWFSTKVSSIDRYIAIMSKTHLSLLSLDFDYDQNSKSDSNQSTESVVDNNCFGQKDCIEWDFEDHSKTIRLPSMFDSGSDSNEMKSHCHQVLGPVDQSLCCKFSLNMNHTNTDSPICRASIQVLMCQYFTSEDPLIDVQTIAYNRENSLPSDPLNASKITKASEESEDLLRGKENNESIGSALLLITKNNLFYYNIHNRIELKENFKLNDKIKSYSVNKTDDTLHIVTEKGLQTYALNYLQTFLKYKSFLPIFQLNFRNFLKIEFLLKTRNHLLLVTESDRNCRTIYSLKKPSLRQIYCDINTILSESHITNENRYNLMSYLNSILHFNCNLNIETDSQVIGYYHKSCVDLCNFLFDSEPIESKQLIQELIESAKLEFSHLINYRLKYESLFVFIDKKLKSDKSFDVNECDFCLLKPFLQSLYSEDITMFCRFCLSQSLESDVRDIIIGQLPMFEPKDSHLPSITLSKLLLENNDIERANNYMNSLKDSIDLYEELCLNYRLILCDNCFVKFFEKSVPNLFYNFLLIFVKKNNSIEFVYHLLGEELDIRIGHNFLNKCYNNFKDLFDDKLILILIEANVELLVDDKNINKLLYSPIESIERPSLEWIELLPPYHREKECFCVKCNPIVSDLYTLLYSVINEDIIKTHINNKIITKIDVQNECLFTARLLSMPTIDALELVLNDFPLILFPFITDVCHSDTILLKKVIHLFDSKINNIEDIENQSHIGIALNFALNQLSVNISPEELIELLPKSWTNFAQNYVKKSIINMQSKVLRQQIIESALKLKSQFI